MTKHADGTVTEYKKHGKLWVLMTMAMVGAEETDRDVHVIGGMHITTLHDKTFVWSMRSPLISQLNSTNMLRRLI